MPSARRSGGSKARWAPRRRPPQAARRARRARPLQFPGAPAQRPHRPGADRRQRGRLQAEREDARRSANSSSRSIHEAGVPEGVVRLRPGRARGGQGARRASRHRRPAVHRLGPRRQSRSTASSPRRRTRSSRSRWAATTRSSCWHARDIHAAAAIAVQSAYLTAGQRCTAARRLIVEDGQHRPLIDDDRQARSTG